MTLYDGMTSNDEMTIQINRHMKKCTFYFGLLAMLLMAGCKDEAEQIPAYLRLEPFVVNESGGAAWQKITEGWLYVNGEFLGAYTLPATVPVLAAGESEVIVFPGVKENGIRLTPNIYPFLTRYEATLNLAPPATAAVQPVTAYSPSVIFPFNGRGDFDDASTLQFENRDSDTITTYSLTSMGAFAGQSLRMQVDTAHPLIQIASEKAELPATAAQEVWLELHYNADMPFLLSLLGSTGGSNEIAQSVYLFNETEGWNKIYLNLTEFLVVGLQEEYQLSFRVSLPRNEQGKYTQNDGTVMLDNIRLLHF